MINENENTENSRTRFIIDTSIQENALGKRKVEFSGNWFKFSG